MLRKGLIGLCLVLALLAAGGVAVARSTPTLTTTGPGSVAGTVDVGVFTVGDRTVRQFRYADQQVMRYTFTVTNAGRWPLTLHGLAETQPRPRLVNYRDLTGADGAGTVELGAGDSTDLTLSLHMSGCETLSARAGSFITEVAVRAEQAGLFTDDVMVTLPEELHTGSPREAFCPESTATSRPAG